MRGLLIALVVFVLVAGILSAALVVFIKLRGTGDVLAKLAPDNSALYVSIYLDPSTTQKSRFNDLLHRFPDVKTDEQRDRKVNSVIDDALRSSHLTNADVRAWLGSQLAVLGSADLIGSTGGRGGGQRIGVPQPLSLTAASESNVPFAVLLDSKDDTKARATLTALRNGAQGQRYDWSNTSHDGVDVSRGTPRSGGPPLVYALVNHAVVLSASESLTGDIIDTAHGKHGSLDSADAYRKAVAGLPSERLVLAYANAGLIAGQIADQYRSTTGNNLPASPPADALRGFAATLTAEQNGFAINGALDYDSSKLTPEQRQQLQGGGLSPSSLSEVPANAFGFFAVRSPGKALESGINSIAPSGSLRRTLDDLGLTGPAGILPHLTGDLGVEVQPRTDNRLPGGALLLATDDEAATRRFLGKLADAAVEATSPPPVSVTRPVPALPIPRPRVTPSPGVLLPRPTYSPVPGYSAAAVRPAPVDRTIHHVDVPYKGLTITAAGLVTSDPHGFLPSYTVSRGVGIIATHPDQVKAVIDAQESGGITSVPLYRSTLAGSDRGSGFVMFVDIRGVVGALRDSLSPSSRHGFDADVAPYLAPLRSAAVTSQTSPDRSTLRLFLAIG